jgi:hypothetical protein
LHPKKTKVFKKLSQFHQKYGEGELLKVRLLPADDEGRDFPLDPAQTATATAFEKRILIF